MMAPAVDEPVKWFVSSSLNGFKWKLDEDMKNYSVAVQPDLQSRITGHVKLIQR